jgi:hypothetical protein
VCMIKSVINSSIAKTSDAVYAPRMVACGEGAALAVNFTSPDGRRCIERRGCYGAKARTRLALEP